MAANRVTLSIRVEVNGKVSDVKLTRPLVLSGDTRKHRAQLRELGSEVVAAATAALGEKFGVPS